MNRSKLSTAQVSGSDDVKAFFDGIAFDYQDTHGPADVLLRYRISIIERLLGESGGTLLEIGCGPGNHLFELSTRFDRLIGTDLSPCMIAVAEQKRLKHARRAAIRFVADPAEELDSVDAGQIDCVLCVGAFEHMLDKPRVLVQAHRVLKPGGIFVCLTPNADYVWYRYLGRLFGRDTRHLSTDQFLTLADIRELLAVSGLVAEKIDYWRFVPGGDMPRWLAAVLGLADWVGRGLNISGLRGGLYLKAVK